MHNMGRVMGFKWVCPMVPISELSRMNLIRDIGSTMKTICALKSAQSCSDVQCSNVQIRVCVHRTLRSEICQLWQLKNLQIGSDFQQLALAHPDCISGQKSCSVFQFLGSQCFWKTLINSQWINQIPTEHLEKHRMVILLTVAQTKRHVHEYLITQASFTLELDVSCFTFSTIFCCQHWVKSCA